MRTTMGIEVGDVLVFWHDTGCFGAQLCYAIVISVTPKRLRVRDEAGRIGIKKPEFFARKVSPQMVAALRADGISI